MNFIMNIVKTVSDWLWSYPLLILIVGGGLFVAFRLGLVQIRYFGYMMSQTFGKIFVKKHEGEGTVTPFQAACTALASSIGAANIVVVPSIIFTAGPGAVFWMWLAAFIGMSTKYTEIVLGMKYREKNVDGEYIGGPAYYLKKGLGGPIGKVLGFCVSFFFMIEILPSITVQTLSAVNPLRELGFPTWLAVGLIFVVVALVVYGGVKRIGQVTELMVPIMAVIYVIFALIVIVLHASAIPGAIRDIFVGAFNPKAIAGGAVGATFMAAVKSGIARGVYSNEAGMGSAPYGHAAAVVDHPCRQGFWGVFEVTGDTVIVCTMSALVVLTTGVWKNPDVKSSVAVYSAFTQVFGTLGGVIIAISLFLFVLSTIIVIVFYAEKQGEYLFGTKIGKVVRLIASLMILAALVITFEKAGSILDLSLALVIIPNMIGVVYLSGEVRKLTKEFFSNPKFYERLRK